MKKEQRKLRLALAFLYALVIFITLAATVFLSAGILYLLVHFDVIPGHANYVTDRGLIILYMAFICLILGSIIAFLTSNLPLKPLNRMAMQLRQLAEGDFKARLQFGFPLNKHMTFVELADSFNTMAEELESTEMLRSDFINNFSHEFKTPIVSVAGFTKLLKKGNLNEEQKMEYLNIIEEEALRLSAMATNVLNLTKIENQSILTDISQFNLSEQIRSSVLLLENRWNKKKIEFNLAFEEHDIEANEELLKEVWINLIDNAIKFSPEYGLVDIRINETKEFYSIKVANAGPDIPEDSQKKIFNKFYQADESHAAEGNGVGLAIVKKILSLHKGEIAVNSMNGLTAFIVEIPKKYN